MQTYADVAARILDAKRDLLARVGPGEFGCCHCGHTAPRGEFKPGRGRQFGQHPEHVYCPGCGGSITWFGFLDGDYVQ